MLSQRPGNKSQNILGVDNGRRRRPDDSGTPGIGPPCHPCGPLPQKRYLWSYGKGNTMWSTPEMNGELGLRIKSGTYVLVFHLESDCRLTVGKLGRFSFPAGWYAYAGSAHGPGGLAARLGHHLHIATHPHWHMDYLRPHGSIAEIWYGRGPAVDEHRWAACLRWMAGSPAAIPGFGSSDCRCDSHLIYFPIRPAIARFRHRQQRLPGVRRRPVFRLPIRGSE